MTIQEIILWTILGNKKSLDLKSNPNSLYCALLIATLAAVRIGFTQEEYYVDEEDEFGNNGEVEICVTIYGELQRSVTVYVTTRSGTAIGKYYHLEVA